MKKLSLILITLIAATAVTYAQPKIDIVGGASFSFGEIYKGDKVERKVTIKNKGNKTLIIQKVQPSCGCTAVLLTDKEVKPGKTSLLTVGFDSKSFSGEVHKNVFVHSNDPKDSSLEITFTAKIIQVIEANPPYFYFKPGKVDSTMSSYVLLKNLSEKPIEILGVSSDDSLAKFELKSNKLPPGQTTQLSVTFTPKNTGYIYKDVIIKTSHPKQHELTIKLVCNVTKK